MLAAFGAGLAFAAHVTGSLDWVHDVAIAALIVGFVVEPLLVFAHEMGHALAARAVGVKVARIRVGSGATVAYFRFAGFDVAWSRHPYSGACELGGDGVDRRAMAILAAAGPLTSLALGAALGILATVAHGGPSFLHYTVVLAAASSALMGIGNAVPFRDVPASLPGSMSEEDGPSDGYLVFQALRGRPIDVTPPRAESERTMTDRAAAAIVTATDLATDGYVGTEHLLQGLLRASGPAAGILRGCGITDWPIDETPARSERPPVPTAAVRRALHRAYAALTLRGDQWIDAEHILLGLVAEPQSEASNALVRLGCGPAERAPRDARVPAGRLARPAEKRSAAVRLA